MTHASNPTAPRISVGDARQRVHSGALLVCAYDDEAKCRQNQLDGSLTLKELEERALRRDQEIIFYCA